MTDRIKLSPQEVDQKVRRYKAEQQSMNGILKNMDKLITELQSDWEGQAAQSFASSYRTLEKSLKDAEQLIGSIAETLNKASKSMVDFDREMSRQLKL